MPKRRLIYISEAKERPSQSDLLSMCAEFASKNAKRDVTGLLLRAGQIYFQVLEGDRDIIEDLAETIAADKRHINFHILSERDCDSHLFSGWGMRLVDCGENRCVTPALRSELQKRLTFVESEFRDGRAKAETILLELKKAVMGVGN